MFMETETWFVLVHLLKIINYIGPITSLKNEGCLMPELVVEKQNKGP